MVNPDRRVTSMPVVVDGVLRYVQVPLATEELNQPIPSIGARDGDVDMSRIQNPNPKYF